MVNKNMIDLGQIYGLTGNNANRYMYANKYHKWTPTIETLKRNSNPHLLIEARELIVISPFK